MKVMLFLFVVLILFITLLFGISSRKGGIWKTIFTLLQMGNIAANNGPGSQ